MSELMYVIKCFTLAVLVTIFMQVKVGTETIEDQAENWIRTSNVSLYLQSVSGGAVLAIKNASKAATEFVAKKLGTSGVQSNLQKASRLDFELKRSNAVEAAPKKTGAATNSSDDQEP
jgi:hypothetical protein